MRNIALAMFILTSFDMEELNITQTEDSTCICVIEDDTCIYLPNEKFNQLCNLLEINTQETEGLDVLADEEQVGQGSYQPSDMAMEEDKEYCARTY